MIHPISLTPLASLVADLVKDRDTTHLITTLIHQTLVLLDDRGDGTTHLAFYHRGDGTTHLTFHHRGDDGMTHLTFHHRGDDGMTHLTFLHRGDDGMTHLTFHHRGHLTLINPVDTSPRLTSVQ